MTLADVMNIVSLLTAHHYLPIAVIVIGYLTRLTSDMSKFPINVPTDYQPVVVVVLGQVYAAIVAVSGGASWKDAVISGLATSLFTMGLFDLVIKAIFKGKEPAWLARLALIFHSPLLTPSEEKAVRAVETVRKDADAEAASVTVKKDPPSRS